MIMLKEKICPIKTKHLRIIIIILAMVITIAILLINLVNSYGVIGYATGDETYNRYVKIKYTYTQNKETNKITLSANYFRSYCSKDGSAFTCSAPLALRYGLYGGTDTQYRKYSATKSYTGQNAGYKGLITLAGWNLQNAVIPQTNGKPVTLTIYGKCDLTGAGKGNHTITKKVDVNGYNGGQKTTTGNVTWIDDNNRDGKRPGDISFKVKRTPSNTDYGATSYTNTKTISSGSWSHSGFAYGYGATYSYSVTYPDISNYTKTVSGNNVTYTYTPEKVTPVINVVWDDNNNINKIRPTSIAVSLIKNGDVAATVNADESSNWRPVFSELYRYEAGKICTFDVKAPDIDGYTKNITGNMDGGYTVAYTYVPGQGVIFGFSI